MWVRSQGVLIIESFEGWSWRHLLPFGGGGGGHSKEVSTGAHLRMQGEGGPGRAPGRVQHALCGALSLEHAQGSTSPSFAQCLGFLRECVPLRMKGLLAVRDPPGLGLAWAVVRRFMGDKLASRVRFLGEWTCWAWVGVDKAVRVWQLCECTAHPKRHAPALPQSSAGVGLPAGNDVEALHRAVGSRDVVPACLGFGGTNPDCGEDWWRRASARELVAEG